MREHIAENVCSLAPVIGREPSISELLPLVKLFFTDEQDGTASIEIRRKVLRSVAPLVETLGAEACDMHLMPEVSLFSSCPLLAAHTPHPLLHALFWGVVAEMVVVSGGRGIWEGKAIDC